MSQGRWWIQPVSVAVAFTLFVVYGTWSVAFGNGASAWVAGPYLSPFYSPLIKLPFWPLSPAFLVAWIPLGFRGTCYYYRKAYYRAFLWDPPACTVAEPRPRAGYPGERGFPWIL
ncbi:MAG TPA: succinate dehydrogenase, partial [Chloroflexota bacterium]